MFKFFQKNKGEDKLKAIKESAEVLGHSVGRVLTDNNRALLTALGESEKRIIANLNRPSVERVDANKTVYGFYLVKLSESFSVGFSATGSSPMGIESMLVLVVASNISEAELKKNAVVSSNKYKVNEWQTVLTNHLPILADDKRFEEPKKEVPQPPIETYITNLLYARDNFAKTPHEKGVLTKIINSIKK